MSTKFGSKDIILLLLHYPGTTGKLNEPIVGRTRVMKMIFLFEKEIWDRFKFGKVISVDSLPTFEAYKYGPFSAKVFEDLEFLSDVELIQVKIQASKEAPEAELEEYKYWRASADDSGSDQARFGNIESFQLSLLGREFVDSELMPKLNENQTRALTEFKSRCSGISLDALLRYVYAKYPSVTKNSAIRDKILS